MTTTQFPYKLENLDLYVPWITDIVIATVVFIVCLVAAYYVLLYSAWFFLVLEESNTIRAKKKTLSDLILMKDIQSEMEKELEQASLKATFQW